MLPRTLTGDASTIPLLICRDVHPPSLRGIFSLAADVDAMEVQIIGIR